MSFREQTIQQVEETIEKALTVKESDISEMKIGDIIKIVSKELDDIGIVDEEKTIGLNFCWPKKWKHQICVHVNVSASIH
jgi:hypothetical protein